MPNVPCSFLHRILVICVIFSIVLSTGCAAPQPAAPEAAGTPAAEEAPADADLEDVDVEALEVRFLEEGYQPASYAAEPLGSVRFTEDSAAAAEQEITKADEALELQVVDGAGLTWTLNIPAGALDGPVTVRMLPLSTVDGSALPDTAGVVTGGVRLEPDGLTFREPARLTVSGAGLDGPTLILAGNQEGGEIDYTLQDVDASDPTSRVLHFSTYFASPLPDPKIAEMNKKAWDEYNQLAAVAKKLRRAPMEVPVPPSIPLDCPDEKTSEAMDQFVQSALNPETELAVKMMKQWRIIALTSETPMEGMPDLIVGMALRVVRKATAMIKQYYGSEEKLMAVTAFALTAARHLALLGGDPAMQQQILADLAEWNRSLIDKLINEIGKNHNYKRIPTAVAVAYHASLLGKADQTGDFLEKLRDVLRFEVKVTYMMEDPFIKAQTISEVVLPLQFEPEYGWIYKAHAEGTGKPLKSVVDEEGWSIKTYKYPVEIWVNDLDPCKGTVKLSIDRFGSDRDTATFQDYTGPWNVAQLSAESVFEAENKDGWFLFTLPIQNGSVNMVEFSLPRTRDDNNVSAMIEVTITHK